MSAGADMRLRVVAVDKLTADLLARTEETDGTASWILALGSMAQPDQWAPACYRTSEIYYFNPWELVINYYLNRINIQKIELATLDN